MFAELSTNYSADLSTRVEPCIRGGSPDCSKCGCAISSGLYWLTDMRVGHIVKIEGIVKGSVGIGSVVGQLRDSSLMNPRWRYGGSHRFTLTLKPYIRRPKACSG